MTIVPDHFRKAIEAKRLLFLENIRKVPIAALVWGPNPTSADPMAKVRVDLKEKLVNCGHYAQFSEELYDPSLRESNLAQQVAQAEAFDIIFSIPSSFGSLGEIHDFARIPSISHKIVAFVDKIHSAGYSVQSLLATQSHVTCRIELYDSSMLPDCIIDCALDQVRRLQELFYMAGRR